MSSRLLKRVAKTEIIDIYHQKCKIILTENGPRTMSSANTYQQKQIHGKERTKITYQTPHLWSTDSFNFK
jgi:hypothetical protein